MMSGTVKGLPILFAVNILSNLIFLKIFFSLFCILYFPWKAPRSRSIKYCIVFYCLWNNWSGRGTNWLHCVTTRQFWNLTIGFELLVMILTSLKGNHWFKEHSLSLYVARKKLIGSIRVMGSLSRLKRWYPLSLSLRSGGTGAVDY